MMGEVGSALALRLMDTAVMSFSDLGAERNRYIKQTQADFLVSAIERRTPITQIDPPVG